MNKTIFTLGGDFFALSNDRTVRNRYGIDVSLPISNRRCSSEPKNYALVLLIDGIKPSTNFGPVIKVEGINNLKVLESVIGASV